MKGFNNDESMQFVPNSREVEHCLRTLVELKIMHDSGQSPEEYKRAKYLAWKVAFRALGKFEEPKP